MPEKMTNVYLTSRKPCDLFHANFAIRGIIWRLAGVYGFYCARNDVLDSLYAFISDLIMGDRVLNL